MNGSRCSLMKRGISRHVKVLQPTTNCDYKMEGLVFSLGLTVVKGGLKIRTRDLINVWKDIDKYQDLDIGHSDKHKRGKLKLT